MRRLLANLLLLMHAAAVAAAAAGLGGSVAHLEELDHRRGDLPAAGADRRSFRVTLTMPSGRAEKEWELEESAAPRSLIVLWKRGAQGLDESDD